MKHTYDYPRPAVTTDVVLITQTLPQKILLIQRGNDPFKGKWAMPGGFVDMDEDLEPAALRELQEETGISGVSIDQFRTYGGIDRDPRHRTISVVYLGLVKSELPCTGMDDAADAKWFDIENLPALAFDHSSILTDILRKLCL